MLLTAQASKHLAQVPRTLHGEFPAVPLEFIEHDLEERVRALLRGAHFDDYIPLLAHRTVRERLRATN